MDPSYRIPGGTIPERITQGGVERVIAKSATQYQVERSGSRTAIPACPFYRGVAPETPNLVGAQGDLVPVMTNEQEVVRSSHQPVEVVLESDIAAEDVAKDFGRECGDVQQGVPSAFELYHDPLVLSDLLLQSSDGFDVNLATPPVYNWIRSEYTLGALAYIDGGVCLQPCGPR